ncbi:Crp/Fnr family transcriptional regulator [Acetobacter fabarum]|uniref:Crp/Fnr family transcriptional regulator n=1 Tax=Acetobacter fabarum TaxID=483199 RepID=UPI00312B5214
MSEQKMLPHDMGKAICVLGLVKGLPPEVVGHVASLARVDVLPAGARVFTQGAEVRRAYAVLVGAVRIRQIGSDGAQALMRMIAPGEMFGTIVLFTGEDYPADAETAMPSHVVSWSKADFLALTMAHPQIAINIIGMVGQRLANVQNRLREMATQSAEQRIAHALLMLVEQNGAVEGKAGAICMPLRRRDVAELAGTTLHTASRMLAAWEKTGLLARSRPMLVVRDASRLRRIAVGEPHRKT